MYQSSYAPRLGDRLLSVDLKAVARATHVSLASPMSQKLLSLVESGDWDAVAQLSCDPRGYTCAKAYLRDAIPANLLRKCVDLPLTGVDVKQNTLKKWYSAEHQCFRTNQRLYPYLKGKTQLTDDDKAIYRHIDGIRKIIESWIGSNPPREIELGFSPGSTLSDRGRTATIAHKISNVPSSTSQYENFGFRHFVGTLWHHNMVDAGKTPSVVECGEYFTVPKTATVERSAELQPSLNVSVQLGYGRLLRKLLRSSTGQSLIGTTLVNGLGWDLKKAQDIHREVAMRASVDRSFCTIDLSSASDTIAKVLVELLLPRSWYYHLDSIRTHRIKLPVMGSDTECVRLLEKFSSMGNGFTFELETIIFAAVACYVTRESGFWGELGFDVFVYGDDIIVRDELYSKMKSILAFLGFTINTEKSFSGPHPFRESCGGDFFNGVNVRCTYLEKSDGLEASEVLTFVNKVKRLDDRLREATLLDLNRLWFHLLAYLPKGIRRVRGPAWLGDSVIYDPDMGNWITDRDEFEIRILTLAQDSSESWIPWHRFDNSTQLAVAVLGFGDGRKGLLPRKPKLLIKQDWAVLQCISAPKSVDARIVRALSAFRLWPERRTDSPLP